jgi:hypothetical protein
MTDHCDRELRECDSRGERARQSGARLSLAANVAAPIGIAAVGAGLYLMLTSDTSEAPPSAAADVPLVAEPGLAARLSWVTLPGAYGLELKGEFR